MLLLQTYLCPTPTSSRVQPVVNETLLKLAHHYLRARDEALACKKLVRSLVPQPALQHKTVYVTGQRLCGDPVHNSLSDSRTSPIWFYDEVFDDRMWHPLAVEGHERKRYEAVVFGYENRLAVTPGDRFLQRVSKARFDLLKQNPRKRLTPLSRRKGTRSLQLAV